MNQKKSHFCVKRNQLVCLAEPSQIYYQCVQSLSVEEGAAIGEFLKSIYLHNWRSTSLFCFSLMIMILSEGLVVYKMIVLWEEKINTMMMNQLLLWLLPPTYYVILKSNYFLISLESTHFMSANLLGQLEMMHTCVLSVFLINLIYKIWAW